MTTGECVAGTSSVAGRRDCLKKTFDSAAAGYQAARPEYPAELFEDLLSLTALAPPASFLEVGCGPGKATVPLAKRGFQITAIELGRQLVATAQNNLRDYENVEVINAAFEEWEPRDEQRFDLIYAATSWAWLDPEAKYAKAAALLRPGRHLAVWNSCHAFPDGFDQFFADVQAVYDEIGESHPTDWPPPLPEDVPDDSRAMAASGLFEVAGARRYVWGMEYTADAYIALLDTFSSHISMDAGKRQYLYDEIRALIEERLSKRVLRHWLAILTVGQLKSAGHG